MKIGLSILFILNVHFSSAQKNNDSIVVRGNIGIDRVEKRKEIINNFAEKINNYKQGKLPSFIFNQCFDLQTNLWEGFHSPVSLRWKVLEKVTNKKALQHILFTNDKRLKKKCRYNKVSNPEITIPMIQLSTFQLLRKRFREL